jgi:hypothetical protein
LACRSTPDPKPDASSTAGTQAEQAPDTIAATPVIPTARPGDSKPVDTPASGSRAERFAALQSEHEAVMNAYYDLFRNAKSDEERQTIAETTKPPDAKVFESRAAVLLDEDPADDTAFDVMVWMGRYLHDDATRTRMVTLLEKHHFGRERMGDLLRELDSVDPAGMRLVERLAEKSPHASVRGRALFTLAERHMEDQRLASEIKDMPDGPEKTSMKRYVGDVRFERLSKADPASFEKPALALLRRVEMEYGSVKLHPGTEWESTLGETAAASMFEIEKLGVGKVAPDIVGEDIDGVVFRLSDYRGKVVMLDFWGFW